MQEANRRLIEIVKLIETNYGRDKITSNLHLSFHLYNCSFAYELLYAFWCFSFEHMNGILGSLPNSNQKIESELMRKLIFDSQVESIISSSGVEMKGLELLSRRPSIGSLSVTDEFSSDEMHQFRINSQNILVSKVSGNENFLGEFLKPSFNNTLLLSEMLDLIVEYYLATYVLFGFWKPFSESSDDDIVIQIK